MEEYINHLKKLHKNGINIDIPLKYLDKLTRNKPISIQATELRLKKELSRKNPNHARVEFLANKLLILRKYFETKSKGEQA